MTRRGRSWKPDAVGESCNEGTVNKSNPVSSHESPRWSVEDFNVFFVLVSNLGWPSEGSLGRQ